MTDCIDLESLILIIALSYAGITTLLMCLVILPILIEIIVSIPYDVKRWWSQSNLNPAHRRAIKQAREAAIKAAIEEQAKRKRWEDWKKGLRETPHDV